MSPDGGAPAGADVAVARLELLTDGAARLDECGVFRRADGRGGGRVHLRNRAYATLRAQLAVAADAVESLLAAHYDTFNASVGAVQTMAAQYVELRRLNADARGRAADARRRLGLAKGPPPATHPLSGDPDAPLPPPPAAPANRVLEHWERQVEAEEGLRLLALLREQVR